VRQVVAIASLLTQEAIGSSPLRSNTPEAVMFCDIHAWTPIPLARARYACTCGATGRKVNGRIRRDRRPRLAARWSARPVRTENGRVMPAPAAP
jgi:hypothetical protein